MGPVSQSEFNLGPDQTERFLQVAKRKAHHTAFCVEACNFKRAIFVLIIVARQPLNHLSLASPLFYCEVSSQFCKFNFFRIVS